MPRIAVEANSGVRPRIEPRQPARPGTARIPPCAKCPAASRRRKPVSPAVTPLPPWHEVAIGKGHDRNAFDCGEWLLDHTRCCPGFKFALSLWLAIFHPS